MTEQDKPLELDLDAIKAEVLAGMSKEDAEKYGENLWEAALKHI